jgi:hypothetical protein
MSPAKRGDLLTVRIGIRSFITRLG